MLRVGSEPFADFASVFFACYALFFKLLNKLVEPLLFISYICHFGFSYVANGFFMLVSAPSPMPIFDGSKSRYFFGHISSKMQP